MRVSWVAPLPPSSAHAASYTVRLLPALAARAGLTLWTTQAEWDRRLEAVAPVRTFDPDQPPWADWNAADVCIYHVSDEPGDDPIAGMSRMHPGVVVLHGNAPPGVPPALGVVVHRLDVFARLKEEDRRPVLYLPPPGLSPAETHAEALLRFAAEVYSFGGALVAQDLARQVAAEVSLWGSAVASPAWLRQVAQEIHQLTASAQAAIPGKARAA